MGCGDPTACPPCAADCAPSAFLTDCSSGGSVPGLAVWAETKAGKRAKRAQAGALRVTVNMEASIRPRVDAGIDRKKEDAPPSGPLKLRREKRRRATRFSGFSKAQDTLS
jgi:hypothetical protein